MRIRSIFLVAATVLSPLGFEAHSKEPVDGDKKSAKSGKRKPADESPQKPAGDGKKDGDKRDGVGERNSCDTLTGIQELGNP